MVYNSNPPPPYNPNYDHNGQGVVLDTPPVYSQPIVPMIDPYVHDQTSLVNNDKFKGSAYRDVFFTILFALHLGAFVFVFVFGLIKYKTAVESEASFVFSPSEFHTLRIYLLVCLATAGLGLVLSFIYLQLIRMYTQAIIIVTMVMSIIMWAAAAIFFLAQRQYVTGIVLLVLTVLNAFILFTWRNRIPFAVIVLKTVVRIIQEYPGTAITAYLSIILHLVFIILWAIATVLAQSWSQRGFAALFVFLLLSLYWTTQVIKNTVHVTVSGTVATWYFMRGTVGVPSNPSLLSFKRATTTSFGSICFGSLLVAALQTIRMLLQMAQNGRNDIFGWIAQCIIGCIESLLQYFNKYAFTQVAIYGKSYIRAAKDTWELVKSHGIAAIINDNIISSVLTVGSLLGGVMCALLGGGLGKAVLPGYWASLAAAGFIIGFSMVLLTMEVIDSGVCTIFVSFAMDREVLRQADPYLFEQFQSRYGQYM